MNFRIITIIFIICITIPSHAQIRDSLFIADSAAPRTAWNNVYVEIGGSNLTLSINYERLINENWGVRLGLWPIVNYDFDTTMGPFQSVQRSLGVLAVLGSSYLIGSGSHKLEVGGSMSIFIPRYYDGGLFFLSGILGYRYQPKRDGLFFRASFTPAIMNSATITHSGDLVISPIGSTLRYQPSSFDFYTFPILPWVGISLGGTF